MFSLLPVAMMLAGELLVVESDGLAAGVGGAEAFGDWAVDAEALGRMALPHAAAGTRGRRADQRRDAEGGRPGREKYGGRRPDGEHPAAHRRVT